MNSGSSEDKARGVGNEVVGKVKEAVGDITGSQEIEAEGTAQQAKGSAQQTMGEAKEAVGEAVGKVTDKASAVAHDAAQTASDALSGRDPEAAKGLVALVTSGGFLMGLVSGVALCLIFVRRR